MIVTILKQYEAGAKKVSADRLALILFLIPILLIVPIWADWVQDWFLPQ